MKLKIKVKRLYDYILLPEVIDKGDWVDLRVATSISYPEPYADTLSRTKGNTTRKLNFTSFLIPTGLAMELPKGFEAIISPRSSTFKRYHLMMTNSIGVIDNTYCSNTDEWKIPVIAWDKGELNFNDRVAQFRIQLSQKATFWQKLKWILCSGIKFVEGDDLGNEERGGFGSTGEQ